jgi:hypothetical protein
VPARLIDIDPTSAPAASKSSTTPGVTSRESVLGRPKSGRCRERSPAGARRRAEDEKLKNGNRGEGSSGECGRSVSFE